MLSVREYVVNGSIQTADEGSAHRRTDTDHAEFDVFRALGGANGRVAEYLGEGI